MRLALVLAGLLLFAPALHAQQTPLQTVPLRTETHRIPERPAAAEWNRPAVAELERTEAPARAEEPAALQPDRTSWWWLIAAIVVAGIIVVAIT